MVTYIRTDVQLLKSDDTCIKKRKRNGNEEKWKKERLKMKEKRITETIDFLNVKHWWIGKQMHTHQVLLSI